MRIFNSEKSFEAAGGLTLSEEMRIVIAARACLLVLHRVELDSPLYSDLQTVIVYPSTYRVPGQRREGYVMIDDASKREPHAAKIVQPRLAPQAATREWVIQPATMDWDKLRRKAKFDNWQEVDQV